MHEMPTFRYLNLELAWPLVELDGLVICPTGELSLAPLPDLSASVGEPLPPLSGFEGPAGIGADPCGDLYVADPIRHRILRVNACDGSTQPLPCLSGPGSETGQLNTPRGLIVGPRRTLYVADAGNGRVQLIDLASGQLRDVWDTWFVEPWDLAVDSLGMIYVADVGTLAPDGTRSGGTVHKLSPAGIIDEAFHAALDAAPLQLGAPANVAVARFGDETDEQLLVLDRQPPRILVYRLDGTFDAEATARWSAIAGQLDSAISIAAASGALYVADPSGERILAFDASGRLIGSRPTGGTVAGVALDCGGRLVAHPGAGAAVRRSLGLPVFAPCGTFLAGPYEADSEPTRWQRIHLQLDPLPDGAHVKLWTLTSNTLDGEVGGSPPLPMACGDIASAALPADPWPPAPLDRWRAMVWDVTDALALNQPARYLWIAGTFQGDGNATPVLRQIRITHDEDGWLRHLPALYSRDAQSRVFLERTLALFETVLDDERALIDSLPRLFDPWAAHDDGTPSWLDSLADWVAAELDQTWPDETRRKRVADAFRSHARRGTRESLRALVRLYAGVAAQIRDTGGEPGLWLLTSSALGADTGLAPAAVSDAVLGATAVVNRAHLSSDEERGRFAFEDVAHRFIVEVYAAELRGAGAAERVRQVLDREKPAHTTYHLCVIQPRMRVGDQARVGIDTIVAGPPPTGGLIGLWKLGTDTVLPAAGAGRLGDMRVGSALSS